MNHNWVFRDLDYPPFTSLTIETTLGAFILIPDYFVSAIQMVIGELELHADWMLKMMVAQIPSTHLNTEHFEDWQTDQ